MSADNEFGIDIVINPATAVAGTMSIKEALAALETRAALTNAKLADLGKSIGAGPRSWQSNEFMQNGDRVVDMFEDWKKGADGATGATAVLAKASDALGVNIGRLGAIGAGVFVAKKVTDYSDAFTNLENRLGTVVEGSAALADVTGRVAKVADDARASFVSTGEFYARLANNTKDLGLSQDRLLGITSTLTKAFKLGGSTAAETSGVMIQLSQAFASGTLRGDELNSVLDQAPILTQAIADSMGIARGQLKEFATQGKVTSAEVIKAIEGMRAEVDERFAKTVPTFGDLMTKIDNKLVQFAGKLAPLLNPLVDVFGSIIDVLGGGLDLVSSLAGMAVGLTAAIELATKLASIVSDILQEVARAPGQIQNAINSIPGFSKIDNGANDPRVVELLKDRQDAVTDAIKQQVAAYSQLQVDVALSRIAEAKRMGLTVDLAPGVIAALEAQQAAYLAIEQSAVEGFNRVAAVMGTVAGAIFNIKMKQLNEDFKAFEQAEREILPVNAATRELATLTEQLTRLVDEHAKSEGDLVEILHAKKVALTDLTDPVGARIGQLKAETANLEEQKGATGARLEFIKEEQKLLAAGVVITGQQRVALAAATKAHYDAEQAIKKHSKALSDAITIETEYRRGKAANDNLARQGDLLSATQRDFRGFTDVDAAVERKFAERQLRMDEQRRKYEEQVEWMRNGGSNAPGAAEQKRDRSPWKDMVDQMRAVDLQTEAMKRGMEGLNGAIDQLVDEGKINFRSLTESMMADLTKLALHKAFGEFLAWASGPGTGSNILSIAGPPSGPGFATGGSMMVGGDGGTDTTPVYLRATRGERVTVETPAQQRAGGRTGGGGRGGVTIHNHLDRATFVAEFSSQEFDQAVNNVVSRREARFGGRRR